MIVKNFWNTNNCLFISFYKKFNFLIKNDTQINPKCAHTCLEYYPMDSNCGQVSDLYHCLLHRVIYFFLYHIVKFWLFAWYRVMVSWCQKSQYIDGWYWHSFETWKSALTYCKRLGSKMNNGHALSGSSLFA